MEHSKRYLASKEVVNNPFDYDFRDIKYAAAFTHAYDKGVKQAQLDMERKVESADETIERGKFLSKLLGR